MGLGWLLSLHRAHVRWRSVLGAFAIQFALGFVVLHWPPGRQALAFGVQHVISYAAAGTDFLVGGLAALGVPIGEALGTVFAFEVLPVIVFFASLLAVL